MWASIGIGLVVLGVLLAIPLAHLTEPQWSAFWSVTYFDVVDLAVTTAFAIFVSWVVAVRLGDRSKRQDAMYSACARLDELAGTAVQAAREYASRPSDRERQRRVVSAFSAVTQWVSVLDRTELCRAQMGHLFRIKLAVRGLKVAVSDDPYGALTESDVPQYLSRIDVKYQRLILESFQQRMNLFR